jgi:hypothetical protein
MSTIINATTTNGVVIQPDNSGSLVLQTNNGTTALTIDTAQNATFAGTVAMSSSFLRNRIINGAMVIDQRNAGAAGTAATNTGPYGVDRWVLYGDVGGKFTYQQNAGAVTPPAGFTNYFGMTSTSAYTVLAAGRQFVAQSIEGFNTYDLDFGKATAKTITLSFWVYSSLTGTFGGSLQNYANTRSYPFTYTISVANTWEYKTVTIAGDTSGTWVGASNAGSFQLTFSLGVGSTFSGTAGAWATANYSSATGATSVVGTNGATFYITGVQLEIGTSATPFERRLYGQELANCQRYYYKVAPGSGGYLTETAFAISTTGAYGANKFPVTMRTAPASLEQSGTAGDYRIVRCGAASSTTCSAVPTFAVATVDRAFTSFAVSSGLVNSGAGAMDAAGANAFLAWSAEL